MNMLQCSTVVSGFYMFLDSFTGVTGDQVALLSPQWNFTAPTQLSFYFYMTADSSQSLSTLQVYKYTQLHAYEQRLYVTQSNSSKWEQAKICLPVGKYHLAFVGTIGSNYLSDIALDEFTINTATSSCSAAPKTNTTVLYSDLSPTGNCSLMS
jgi:hypothetical protein